jgi:hypothetical protein
MKPTTAAYAAFFTLAILNSSIANAEERPYREMFATSSTGAEFIVTNQPCGIDFHEPTNFIYHGYFVQDGVRYDACWYGNDAAIWMAVDHFRQITSLDPNSFRLRQDAKQFRGEF